MGPWSVSNPTGDGVYVDGTDLTKSFVLYDLTANGNAGNGITLTNINTAGGATITAEVYGGQTTANKNTWGIQVANSSGVALEGVGANNRGPGIAALPPPTQIASARSTWRTPAASPSGAGR